MIDRGCGGSQRIRFLGDVCVNFLTNLQMKDAVIHDEDIKTEYRSGNGVYASVLVTGTIAS